MKRGNKKIYILSAVIFVIGILIMIGIFIQARNVVRFGSVLAMSLMALIELGILIFLVVILVKELSGGGALTGTGGIIEKFSLSPNQNQRFKNYKNLRPVYQS